MLGWFHTLLMGVYAVLPVVAVLWALRAMVRRRGSVEPLSVLLTALIGAGIGISATLVWATWYEGRVTAAQVLVSSYFATSLLLVLKLGDRLLTKLLRSIMSRRDEQGVRRSRRGAVAGAFLVRAALLFAAALPYVLGSLLVYRPRIHHAQTPATIGLAYEQVTFTTSDGLTLRGWWVPAQTSSPMRLTPSDRTVIVCHGLGVSAEGALPLAEQLAPYGFNVLMFDFRAHGFSDGQLTTFGAMEKRDVLAAVGWVRGTHPQASVHLYGAGVGLGAAALIGAATDPAPRGQAIEAVALYAPYASLSELADATLGKQVPEAVKWMIRRGAFPVASLTAGTDLVHYSPASQVVNVWPRPVLVIHGLRDGVIPFAQGEQVYDAAARPRHRLWLLRDNHAQSLRNPEAGARMRLFFAEARPVPVV